jgi:hypothetical protein
MNWTTTTTSIFLLFNFLLSSSLSFAVESKLVNAQTHDDNRRSETINSMHSNVDLDLDIEIMSNIIPRELNGTSTAKPPPNNNKPKKKKSTTSHSSSTSGGSSGSSSGSSSSGSSSSSSSSSSGGTSHSTTTPSPAKKSGAMFTGMAAVAVLGVAALYSKENRTIVTAKPHALQGVLAKRMARFDTLAGKVSPRSGGGASNVDDDDSDTVYVSMDSNSAGGNMMAEV